MNSKLSDTILLASRAEARVIKTARDQSQWKVEETLENPNGRLRNRDINADKPGSSFAKFHTPAAGHTAHRLDGEKDPHEVKAAEFANRIAEFLEKQRHKNEINDITISCEPHFMGLLREAIKRKSNLKNVVWVKKDLLKVPLHDLPKYFA